MDKQKVITVLRTTLALAVWCSSGCRGDSPNRRKRYLHGLSCGAFIPMIATEIHPLLSGLFVMFTMGVMVPLTVLFLIKEHKKS